MPIYEFSCNQCRHQFDVLVLSSGDPAPKCPKCGSEDVKKLISAGAIRPHGIPSGSGGFSSPPCSSSGG